MDLVVRAFSILPGQEQRMRDFAHEVRTTRAVEANEFYRRMGVMRESWHLQETDHGAWVIGVTQISERSIESAAADYASSQHPFDRWFKDQVLLVAGVDPDKTPLGPPTECIFDTGGTVA